MNSWFTAGAACLVLAMSFNSSFAQVYELPKGSTDVLGTGLPQGISPSESLNQIAPGSLFEPMAKYRNSSKLEPISRMVGLLSVTFPDESAIFCTANLISNTLLLTNAHCMNSRSGLTFSTASFSLNYLDGRKPEDAITYSVEQDVVEMDIILDFAILELSEAVQGFIPENIIARDPRPGEPLMVVGHPYGYPMHITRGGCLADGEVPFDETRVFHHCDTLAGNSGSLLFSDDEPNVVVGLHRSALGEVNVGARIGSIIESSPSVRTAFLVPSADEISDAQPPRLGGASNAGNEIGDVSVEERLEARAQLDGLWKTGRELDSQGNVTEYLATMERSLEVSLAYFGPESEEYAQANNHLIGAFTSAGQIEKAVKAAREAIRVFSTLYGPDHPQVANDKSNLAARLFRLRKYNEAEKEWQEALRIFEENRLMGWERRAHAVALQGYARFLIDAGEAEEARPLANQAIEILQSGGLGTSTSLGQDYLIAADIETKLGSCKTARSLYENAIEIFIASNTSERHSDFAAARTRAARNCS